MSTSLDDPTPSRPARRRLPDDPRVNGIKVVVAMLALMWAVELADTIDDHRLDGNGIRPRDVDGLLGIVFAPFLHASWGHLIGNSVPFLVLGAMTAIGGARRVIYVTLVVGFVGGAGTWLIAPDNTVHLGASGLVFGFATYLISRGLFEKSPLHLGVGAIVVVLYGSALVGGLVPQDGISWQGHLCGGIGGVIAAKLLAEERERDRLAPGAAVP